MVFSVLRVRPTYVPFTLTIRLPCLELQINRSIFVGVDHTVLTSPMLGSQLFPPVFQYLQNQEATVQTKRKIYLGPRHVEKLVTLPLLSTIYFKQQNQAVCKIKQRSPKVPQRQAASGKVGSAGFPLTPKHFWSC